MSESKTQEKLSNKRCILTEKGSQKLSKVIQDKNDSDLARTAGLDRETVKKIRLKEEAVTFNSLNRLFESLNLDLEPGDYQKLEKPPTSHRKKAPEPLLQPIIEQTQTEKFIDALYQLDYDDQRTSFNKAINHVKPAATFFIHGKPDYGQRWLVNLLKFQVPYHTNAWQETIYIRRNRKDIDLIWQSLANKLQTDPSPPAIAEKLYRQWETQTVILAIHDVDLIAGSCLKNFMDELWQPLVVRVNNTQQVQKNYRMVLFLVDHKNSKSKLEKSLSFLTEIDINKSHIPFVLKELEPFNKNLLETWAGTQEQLLSPLWKSSDSIEQIMCEIVEENNQPNAVFKEICRCFDFEWSEIEKGRIPNV